MTRLRYNDVLGSASGNPATTSTTTITWSSTPAFPTIASPNFAVIVLEPDTSNEEIVYLTAYTSGQTTGTIARNQEATQGGQNSSAEHTAVAWIHGPTADDFGSYTLYTASTTVTPAAGVYVVRAVGGGGAGGAGYTPAADSSGGGGGGAGGAMDEEFALNGTTALTITIGAGGTPSANVGGNGGDTSVTGSGVTVKGLGGGGGGEGVSGLNTGQGGLCGCGNSPTSVARATGIGLPGQGSTNASGSLVAAQAGPPTNVGCTGGGDGGLATSAGGTGGAAGTLGGQPANGTANGSGSTSGAAGGTAAANSGCGGGGGGGSFTGGTQAQGGAGGSGWVEIWRIA